MEQWIIIWAVAAAAFIIIELVTVTFVAVYFAIGSAAAAAVALGDGGFALQLVAFSVTGVVLLLLTRPLLKKRLESPDVPTNVSRMVGKGGIVTITIDNDANTGQIRVGTEYWTARLVEGLSDEVLPVDSRVTVEAIEGVTARVRPRAAAPSTVD